MSTSSSSLRRAGLAGAAFVLAQGTAAPASAAPDGPTPRGLCSALAGKIIGGAELSSAEFVPATASLAAYCKVRGLIEPKLNFELRLPNRPLERA